MSHILSGAPIPNRGEASETENLSLLLPDAVRHVEDHLRQERVNAQARLQERLAHELEALRALKNEHLHQVELDLGESALAESRKQAERTKRYDAINRKFEQFEHWIESTWKTEDDPYIQIVAVISGDSGGAAA